MKHRDKYELVYRQLCKAAGFPLAGYETISDYALMERMNGMLGMLNCIQYTSNEIYDIIEQ